MSAQKTKTKKQVKAPKSKRLIVKRRRKKLTIAFVVISIIVGLSVGLYFAFRTVYDLPSNINEISQKELTEKIEDTISGEETDTWGVYVGTVECQFCKDMLYGPSDENGNWDTENADGAFSEYVDSGESTIDWYILENHKKNSPEEQLQSFHNAVGDAYINAFKSDDRELRDGDKIIIDYYGNVPSTTTMDELELATSQPEVFLIEETGSTFLLEKDGDNWNWNLDDGNDLSPVSGTPSLIVFDHDVIGNPDPSTNISTGSTIGIVSVVSGYSSGGDDGGEMQTEDWYLTWDEIIYNFLAFD